MPLQDTTHDNPGALTLLFSNLLPQMLKSHRFLEELHTLAANLHKQGQAALAQDIFRLVRSNAGAFPELEAWAWYKEGEIHMEQGREAEASACFDRTLALSPGHIKLRFLRHPALEPLRISLGKRPNWHPKGIELPFLGNNLELWRYHLHARPADELWISPPQKFLELTPATLDAVLKRYLTEDSVVILALTINRQVRITASELQALLLQGEESYSFAVAGLLEKFLA